MTAAPPLVLFSIPENTDPTYSKFGSSRQPDSRFRRQHMSTVMSWRMSASRHKRPFHNRAFRESASLQLHIVIADHREVLITRRRVARELLAQFVEQARSTWILVQGEILD